MNLETQLTNDTDNVQVINDTANVQLTNDTANVQVINDTQEYVYTVYCEDDKGVNILKNAFYKEEDAYNYALKKIRALLELINEDFMHTENKVMTPIYAQLIYAMFKLKDRYDNLEPYYYFKENYRDFFRYINRESVMFFVIQLKVI